MKIPFPTERQAQIAYDVLRIDPEPPRSAVTKQLQLESNQLIAYVNPTKPNLLFKTSQFHFNLFSV